MINLKLRTWMFPANCLWSGHDTRLQPCATSVNSQQLQADKSVSTGPWQPVALGALSTLSQTALGWGPTMRSCPYLNCSQTNSLVKQSSPRTGVYVCVCVWMSKWESKGWDFMLFWKICHHKLRMHYIVIISLVFQLPVTFSDLLIFSMIFSHICSITPNTLSTHYPVFACTIFIHVTQYSKWVPLFNVLINLYKNRHVTNVCAEATPQSRLWRL